MCHARHLVIFHGPTLVPSCESHTHLHMPDGSKTRWFVEKRIVFLLKVCHHRHCVCVFFFEGCKYCIALFQLFFNNLHFSDCCLFSCFYFCFLRDSILQFCGLNCHATSKMIELLRGVISVLQQHKLWNPQNKLALSRLNKLYLLTSNVILQ